MVPTLVSLWQEKTSETIWPQIFSSGFSGGLCRKIWFPSERLVMSGSRMMVALTMRIETMTKKVLVLMSIMMLRQIDFVEECSSH